MKQLNVDKIRYAQKALCADKTVLLLSFKQQIVLR